MSFQTSGTLWSIQIWADGNGYASNIMNVPCTSRDIEKSGYNMWGLCTYLGLKISLVLITLSKCAAISRHIHNNNVYLCGKLSLYAASEKIKSLLWLKTPLQLNETIPKTGWGEKGQGDTKLTWCEEGTLSLSLRPFCYVQAVDSADLTCFHWSAETEYPLFIIRLLCEVLHYLEWLYCYCSLIVCKGR